MFQNRASAPIRLPPIKDDVLRRRVKQSLVAAQREAAAIPDDELWELFRKISVVTDKGRVREIGALALS